MKNNILKNFLIDELELSGNINWSIAVNYSENFIIFKEKDIELLNYVAFSFIDVSEKKKLFTFIKNSQISEKIMDNLFNYFEEYFRNLSNKYPLKDNLYKDFVKNFLNWIEITNGKIDQQSISNILKNIQSKNDLFWLFLVKELHSRKLHIENSFLLSKKKSKLKKSKYYEDFILYELFTITSLPNYINKNKQVDKLCQLSEQIVSYSTSKLFFQLECALLKSNKQKFELLIEKNTNLLTDFTIIELLYIYEYAILISSEKSIEMINMSLYKQDISSYTDSYELYLYEFFNLLKKRDYISMMAYVRKLYDRDYNFTHILWYLEKKVNKKDIVIYIKSIIED